MEIKENFEKVKYCAPHHQDFCLDGDAKPTCSMPSLFPVELQCSLHQESIRTLDFQSTLFSKKDQYKNSETQYIESKL